MCGWWIKDVDRMPLIIWHALPSVICWGLWKEKNARIFKDRAQSEVELILFIYKALFDWVSVWAAFEEITWYSI